MHSHGHANLIVPGVKVQETQLALSLLKCSCRTLMQEPLALMLAIW